MISFWTSVQGKPSNFTTVIEAKRQKVGPHGECPKKPSITGDYMPTQCVTKGGKFKKRKPFNYHVSFLFCLYSNELSKSNTQY